MTNEQEQNLLIEAMRNTVKQLKSSTTLIAEEMQKFLIGEINSLSPAVMALIDSEVQRLTALKNSASFPSHPHVIDTMAITLQGESHKKVGSICQDFSETRIINDQGNSRFVIVAVADGVGACKRSDEGSRIAVNSSLDWLENYFADNTRFQGLVDQEILRNAMVAAYNAVYIDHARNEGASYEDFSTTLTVAVYDIYARKIIFGHSGDGGLVVLDMFGNLEKITIRGKVNDGPVNHVIPLENFHSWTFGSYENVVAFALMTDGIYDYVSPLHKELQGYLYCNDVPFFANLFYYEDLEKLKSGLTNWLNRPDFRAIVDDDITLVSVVNQVLMKHVPPIVYDAAADALDTKAKEEAVDRALYPYKYK